MALDDFRMGPGTGLLLKTTIHFDGTLFPSHLETHS
jgi:hypothetical protein